ncbi:MAG: Ig-like domain-containing protein [Candidatus Methanoperedens sp.]|nr:Ig-like domain-containing protein [Candidatus Methanoperedens sp.]
MVSFIKDERGTMEIPLRFVVYVMITGAIIALVAIGISRLEPGITEDTLEKQIGAIKVSLAAMQSGAARNLIDPASPGGNIRTYKIVLPQDVGYLAFGADPDPDNDGDLTNTKDNILTDMGNVIIYSSSGGKKIIPLDENTEIREGIFKNGRWVMNSLDGKQYGVVIRGSGKSEIIFELVYDPITKERYTLAHFTDDLNAVINPYDPAVLPNSVLVYVDPNWIPADGVTDADVIVQLKDARGQDATKYGVEVNLTASGGTLGRANLTTVTGRARTNITSDVVGTAMITASSAGLNPGSTYLTVKQVPIVLVFGQWLSSEDEELTASFSTTQDIEYKVSFRGNGTKFSVPFVGTWWANASIFIDGAKVGEEMIDSETIFEKEFTVIALAAGNHTMKVRLRNDLSLPFMGDTNLYAERITLSE